ncbi:MAG: hypothetical protein RR854_00270 [Muribaculaceae bacterium]
MKRNCNCGYSPCIPEPPFRGKDGLTPFIGKNGNWWIGIKDTGVKATGENGVTPNIGINGNWFIGATDTGIKATGDAATISVGSTTTLPAGSQATVVNTGTPSAAIFNFGIPQGQKGSAGVLENSIIRGAIGNDTDQPQLVASGSPIKFKEIRGNATGLITMGAADAFFNINKTGTYLCIMNLCAATNVAGDNTVVSWGLYAKKANTMLTSASNFLTQSMQGISSVCIFDVKDVTEQFNIINNSKVQIRVQGIVSAQVVHNTMQYSNNLAMTDGIGIAFIRLGDTI